MRLIAFDSETYLIEPGIPAPKGVVTSWFGDDAPEGILEWFTDGMRRLEWVLMTDRIIAGANIAFDFGCALRERPDLIDLVFAKYERGEVWELFCAQALDAIAKGHLFKEPSGGAMRSRGSDGQPFGKARGRYALDLLAYLVLGIANSKANDEYKLRYRELEGIPFEQWPESARIYPIDDARDTYQIAGVQRATFENCGLIVQHVPNSRTPPKVFGHTHQTHQARAAFCMHLASVWGLRTNLADTEALAARIEADTKDQIAALVNGGKALIANETGGKDEIEIGGGLLKHGYVTKNKRVPNPLKPGKTKLELVTEYDPEEYAKENRPAIKRRVILAYGGSDQNTCPMCKGTGKIKSPRSGAEVTCGDYYMITEGTAQPRWSDHNEARKTCDGTGLVIPYTVPRSDGGGVSINRDTLEESHDQELELLAEIGPSDTIKERFVPWLLEGTRVPINTRPNTLVETTRASYDGIIQTLPRKGGVRECIEARPGYVFCSVDYNALELSTLAQCCIWICGYSSMGDAINAGKDLHSYLAAQMVGQQYDAFLARVKLEELKAVDFRQAAKQGNFGFGGMMGAPKFVLTQRKSGLRMCRLAGREAQAGCGSTKLYEWKRKPCAPTCEACALFSEELRSAWSDTWFEMKEYFRWVGDLPGMERDRNSDEVYDSRQGGTIISPGSGFKRAALTAPSAANHGFQHLAAMGAKHALWNVSRECYTVRSSALYGSRVVLFLHDELIAEVPEQVAHEAGYRMAEVMVSSMREFVPDVRVSAEPALMRRWYKGAKTVHDPATGRLIPWAPKILRAA